nr:alpha/beta hydrolase family protein [Corynebacterium mendelii]
MTHSARPLACLTAACLLAVAAVTTAPAASAGTAAPTGGATATVIKGTPPGPVLSWHRTVADDDRLEEYYAFSPSMRRQVPLFVMKPKNNSVPRPIVYVLNGGDGGEGVANWLAQSDLIDFYRDKNVWVVMPMSGQFSYYTDWVEPNESLGGVQMWETFLTTELPAPMEQQLGASSRRGIIGMSMSATTTLLYAEHHPGFYDAVGSFSGCAETSRGFPYEYVRLVLERGNATPEQMWGPVGGERFNHNDGLLNAARLKETKHLYISSGTGLMGPHDIRWGTHKTGSMGLLNKVITGGLIEAGVNKCTHDLKARTDQLGMTNIDYNFRPTGTHSWGYWQQDLVDSWPTFARAFGMDPQSPRTSSESGPAAVTAETVDSIWKAAAGADPHPVARPGTTTAATGTGTGTETGTDSDPAGGTGAQTDTDAETGAGEDSGRENR